jgi:hypothetical protein
VTRPARKPAKSPRRSGAVLVLLTPEERENARRIAEGQGMPLGTWIRVLILRAAGAA